jgi:hypothetical protein
MQSMLCRYLKEPKVKAAILDLASIDPLETENPGIMAVLCAAARGVLFLTIGEYGEFDPTRVTSTPDSANECLAYINELSFNRHEPTAGGFKRQRGKRLTSRRKNNKRSTSRRKNNKRSASQHKRSKSKR